MRRNNQNLCFGVSYNWGPIVMNSQTQKKIWKFVLSSKGCSYLQEIYYSNGQQTLQKL